MAICIIALSRSRNRQHRLPIHAPSLKKRLEREAVVRDELTHTGFIAKVKVRYGWLFVSGYDAVLGLVLEGHLRNRLSNDFLQTDKVVAAPITHPAIAPNENEAIIAINRILSLIA